MVPVATDKGIVLMGEAAQSWVTLQWFHEFISIGIVLLVLYGIYKVVRIMVESVGKDKN